VLMRNGVRSLCPSNQNVASTLNSTPKWIIVSGKGCKRTACVLTALQKKSIQVAHEIDYIDLVNGNVRLQELVEDRSIVRIDSMVEDIELRHAVMKLGRDDAEAEGSPVASENEVLFEREQGNYSHPLWGRQIYLGMIRLLESMTGTIETNSYWVNSPQEIRILYDKYDCQKALLNRGIPIPAIFGQPKNFEELREIGKSHTRLMLKTSHGSGGAGCVAVHSHRGMIRAFTPLRFLHSGTTDWLYCGKSIRCVRDELEIAQIVNRLCLERCHVEEWLPKSTIGNERFDVRVVTIGGRATHQVARLSNGPMTNLNLGNRRMQVAELNRNIPWYNDLSNRSILNVCEDVARAFPETVTLGIDVLVRPDRSIAVLEVNAFGGLLNGTEHQGKSTFEMEVNFVIDNWQSQDETLRGTQFV
jgi:glutathione synthase/RimK-type ligase-like ATP-grasp enzyme